MSHADQSNVNIGSKLFTASTSSDAVISDNVEAQFNDIIVSMSQVSTRSDPTQSTSANQCIGQVLHGDLISALSEHEVVIPEQILSYLDAKSLVHADCVSQSWRHVIADGSLWKKLIERTVNVNSLWMDLAEKRDWIKYLFNPLSNCKKPHDFYRKLYSEIYSLIQKLELNWRTGTFTLRRVDGTVSVVCLQCDDDKIVAGLADYTIKMWDRNTLGLLNVFSGHTNDVVCLQFDDHVIISGSWDATIRVWDIRTGETLNTINYHSFTVNGLRFVNDMLITYGTGAELDDNIADDKSLAVWVMVNPTDIKLRCLLRGHDSMVNVVDFDEKYIVTGSRDSTIKIWLTDTCILLRTLEGHDEAVFTLHYRDGLVVSGSWDETIRIWDVETGGCLRILTGQMCWLSCVKFDHRRIVSGDFNGDIKVWDLRAALEDETHDAICLQTLSKHRGWITGLQINEYEIVSSSAPPHLLTEGDDGAPDLICPFIWDFLN